MKFNLLPIVLFAFLVSIVVCSTSKDHSGTNIGAKPAQKEFGKRERKALGQLNKELSNSRSTLEKVVRLEKSIFQDYDPKIVAHHALDSNYESILEALILYDGWKSAYEKCVYAVQSHGALWSTKDAWESTKELDWNQHYLAIFEADNPSFFGLAILHPSIFGLTEGTVRTIAREYATRIAEYRSNQIAEAIGSSEELKRALEALS